MPQLELAKLNKVSPQMRFIAKKEGFSLGSLIKGIRDGRIVIIKNRLRSIRPCAVGEGLRTKVNANLGTSQDRVNLKKELKKLKTAIQYGSDTVMDLSTGGDIRKLRKEILASSNIPLGTVPIYEGAIRAQREKGHLSHMTAKGILDIFEEQARDGVDFFTVHCGITQETLSRLKKK